MALGVNYLASVPMIIVWGAVQANFKPKLATPEGMLGLLPGAGPTGFKVKYSGITGKTKEYYREYASALKRGGYVFMEEAPNDDPQDGIMAGIFQKKEHRVRLTVYADAHTHAEVKEEVE